MINNKSRNLKTESQRPKIIISGIGTGGHYFPAIVVAQELLRRHLEIMFLVRQGYLEERIANRYRLKTFYTKARPFYGKSILGKFLFLFSFIHSISRLNSITKKNIGLSFGGFGSLPLIFSCLIKRRPFYIFEPNSFPGRATKLVAAYAKKIFLGMPPVTDIKGKLLITGIPIRNEFKELRQYKRAIKANKKTILFVGGSQGAKSLNSLALELSKILPQHYEIIIISGHRDYDWVNKNKDSRTKVIPFTDKPWQELGNASVIISRGGALAGYEILSLNRKVIFIPFPFAVDNHQYYNSGYFIKFGNGVMLEEKGLTKEILMDKITQLLRNEDKETKGIILDAQNRIADEIEKEMI